jgi:hypothetical protein
MSIQMSSCILQQLHVFRQPICRYLSDGRLRNAPSPMRTP